MNAFRHSISERNSIAALKLRKVHGPEGYGVYMMLLEFLCGQPSATSPRDYETLAYHLDTSVELVRTVIEDFGLFILSDSEFTHRQFAPKLQIESEKVEKSENPSVDPEYISRLDETLEKISDKDLWINQAASRIGGTYGQAQVTLLRDFREDCIKNRIVLPEEPEELFNTFYESLSCSS